MDSPARRALVDVEDGRDERGELLIQVVRNRRAPEQMVVVRVQGVLFVTVIIIFRNPIVYSRS